MRRNPSEQRNTVRLTVSIPADVAADLAEFQRLLASVDLDVQSTFNVSGFVARHLREMLDRKLPYLRDGYQIK